MTTHSDTVEKHEPPWARLGQLQAELEAQAPGGPGPGPARGRCPNAAYTLTIFSGWIGGGSLGAQH